MLGIALVISARLSSALPPDRDGETVGWFIVLAAISAVLLGGAAGFIVARHTRRILPAVLVGAVTGLLGGLLASASLLIGAFVGHATLSDMGVAVIATIPFGVLCADAGLLGGAVGGALALSRDTVRALWAARKI
jgi:hypothetical protein